MLELCRRFGRGQAFAHCLFSGRRAAAVVLAAMLTACGGNAPPPADPMDTFTLQKLDWQACAPVFAGEARETMRAQLGARVQCALMRVPLDYADPGLGELPIELLRVAAAQPQQRLGAIVFNPGGPGMDGLEMALVTGAQWAQLPSEEASAARLREMGERYDLMGFSPRGVGASYPLVCDLSSPLAEQEDLTFDRSAENLQHAQRNARLVAQACQTNPLSHHLHTEATARDMDLLRTLLGEARLHYIGYSYGTWLGAWYARLFPERVGRMLLDSSLNIVERLDDQFISQEMANQRILDQVMLPYAERHKDKLALGSAGELRASLQALSPALKTVLMEDMNFTSSSAIDAAVVRMSAAVGLGQLMRLQPGADEQALQTLVQNHAFSPVPRVNAVVVQQALEMVVALNESSPSTPPWLDIDDHGQAHLLPEFSVNMSVCCNDTGVVGDEQFWLSLSHDYVARYPLTGGSAVFKPCLHWTSPPRKPPPLPSGAGAAILMLQSRYDGSTPVEGAMATLAALPTARMILVENEYEHGLFPYGTDCVDGQVAAYFLHGTLPTRLSSCAGKPLAGEAGAEGGVQATLGAVLAY